MKKKTVSKLFKEMLLRAHQAFFAYQVRHGLIMCAVEPEEGGEVVIEQEEADESEQAEDGGEETGEEEVESESGDDDEVVITIGDEPPPAEEEKAPEWVRELRKSHRELVKENRELKAKQAAPESSQKSVTLGNKPKLDDFDYDTEKYEQELAAWYERKREIDSEATQREAAQAEQQKAWQARLDAYGQSKAGLKVKDYDDAEESAKEALSVTQQGVILQGAENPALVVYALGKNPKKAKELAAVTDPVKFAFAIAKLETQLKVTKRNAPPPPEKTVTGTARNSGSVDSNLDRLRSEAEKTGDYSKVMAYKRQKKAA